MEIASTVLEIENRVANELSWSVVGCLATAADFHYRMRQWHRLGVGLTAQR